MTSWSRLLKELYDRIVALIQASSPATTGVLGLALLVLGYFQLRGFNAGNGQRAPSDRSTDAARAAERALGQRSADAHQSPSTTAGTSTAPADACVQQGDNAKPHASTSSTGSDPPATASALTRSVADKLMGIRRISISIPGVLLHEWDAHDLQDAATVRTEAIQLVQEAMRCAPRDVYLIAHIVDDIGQAAVSGALEAAGLVGYGTAQVAPHRLLFCSTLEGKVSMVRQLESELHIDGHAATVEELRRFMPQLVHVSPTATPGATAPNVGHAASLASFFGL